MIAAGLTLFAGGWLGMFATVGMRSAWPLFLAYLVTIAGTALMVVGALVWAVRALW